MTERNITARIRVSSSRIGLLLTAFLMLGLIGVFATYAAPIPAMRGMITESELAQAIAANDPAKIKQAMTNAQTMLGTTALKKFATLKPTPQGAAAAALLLDHESAAGSRLISYRLRLEVIVIGVVAGLFGVALLGIGDAASKPTPSDDQPEIMQP